MMSRKRRNEQQKEVENMDPIHAACQEVLRVMEGKNIPITVNDPNRKGVVFVYSGENWEVFSEAIRVAVDKVQNELAKGRR